MKKSEITIGNVYMAKITDDVVPVRLDQENPVGGYAATNLATGKTVRIKSPAKLRRPASEKDIAAAESARAERKKSSKASKAATSGGRKPARGETAAKSKPKATKGSKPTRAKRGPRKEAATAKGSGGAKRSGGGRSGGSGGGGVLDAAEQVLRASKEPMRCTEMIEVITDKGLWSTNGKTPSATLYSAILREIQRKGKESRFEKVDRGRFQIRKGA